jgi:exosortase/archaeosortase family protein
MYFKTFFTKQFIIYVLKFILIFCICYYGSLLVEGITAVGGYYSGFIDHNFNYIKLLRTSLLDTSKWVLSSFGYQTYRESQFVLRMKDGIAVKLVYSCLGLGVMSFWVAFIIANAGSWIKKAKWILGGLLLIWCINVARISLLLVAINRQWKTFFSVDHHTLFNIAAYSAIFVMIYFFSRSDKDLPEEDPLRSGVE